MNTRRKPPISRKSLTNFITTLVMICTDCIGILNPTTIRSRLRRPLHVYRGMDETSVVMSRQIWTY
jgi:hypothetical protein